MKRRFVSTQEAREKFAEILRRASEGEDQIINHRGKIGHAIVISQGSYLLLLKALGEPIPDWAATDE